MKKKKVERFITLECPGCETTTRAYRADYDPPEAALLMIRCPNCSEGCKEDGGTYYDSNGNAISDPDYRKLLRMAK